MHRVAVLAIALVGWFSSAALAQEFLLPSQCKQLKRDDDNLGATFKRAAQLYDIYHGSKTTLDEALAAVNRDLAWAGGAAGNTRRGVAAFGKLCDALGHFLSVVTPKGYIVEGVAEFSKVSAVAIEKWSRRLEVAKFTAEQAAEKFGTTPEKKMSSTGGELVQQGLALPGATDLIEGVVTQYGDLYGAKYAGPVAHVALEMNATVQSFKEALEIADSEEQHKYEEAARRQVELLRSAISNYEFQMKQALASMDAIRPFHDAIVKEYKGSCSSKICDDLDKAALATRDRKIAEADKDWKQAQDLRKAGPDIKQVDKEYADTIAKIRSVDSQAKAKLDDLSKQLNDLIAEEKAALDELRKGLFCSKCRRTKTEIEKEEHLSFETHLGNVQGRAVPATNEEIAERGAEYEQKIASAQRALAAADKDYSQRRLDLQTTLKKLEKICEKLIVDHEKRVLSLETQARKLAAAAETDYNKVHQKTDACRAGYSS